ncbi:MAG: AgmX/PglI C-terminal domain-containing protein [Myxococcota bacterium]
MRFAFAAVLAALPVLAQQKEAASGTMKELIKDATNTQAATADPNAPDIEKMPFTPDSIRAVVTYHLPKIQSCYEETLAGKEKKVAGKLMTKWVITPEGIVSKARVEKKGTTLREPKLHDCVVAVLSTMSFPKPPDGKNRPIEYPFNLKAIE